MTNKSEQPQSRGETGISSTDLRGRGTATSGSVIDSVVSPTERLFKTNSPSPQIRTSVEPGPNNNEAVSIAMMNSMDIDSSQRSMNVVASDVQSSALAEEGNLELKTVDGPIAVNQTSKVEGATSNAEKPSNPSKSGNLNVDKINERVGDANADNARPRRPSPWIWANRQRTLFPKINDGRYSHWKSEQCMRLAKANPCHLLRANYFVTFK